MLQTLTKNSIYIILFYLLGLQTTVFDNNTSNSVTEFRHWMKIYLLVISLPFMYDFCGTTLMINSVHNSMIRCLPFLRC